MTSPGAKCCEDYSTRAGRRGLQTDDGRRKAFRSVHHTYSRVYACIWCVCQLGDGVNLRTKPKNTALALQVRAHLCENPTSRQTPMPTARATLYCTPKLCLAPTLLRILHRNQKQADTVVRRVQVQRPVRHDGGMASHIGRYHLCGCNTPAKTQMRDCNTYIHHFKLAVSPRSTYEQLATCLTPCERH